MQPTGRGGPERRSGTELLGAKLWKHRFVRARPWGPAADAHVVRPLRPASRAAWRSRRAPFTVARL